MLCSHCGQTNRPNAHFCARCGTKLGAKPVTPASAPAAAPPTAGQVPLTLTATMKVCPRCATHNRWKASVCTHCSYHFSGQSTQQAAQLGAVRKKRSGQGRKHQWWLWGVGLLLLLLFVGVRRFTTAILATPPQATTPTSTHSVAVTATPNGLQQALVSVIQVIVPNDGQSNSASIGSGSVVSSDGHILTNFHVLGDIQTRQLHNQAGLILIAMPPLGQSSAAPVIRYRAALVQADYLLDLALLQISATDDGGALPLDLGLTPLSVDDSDTVQIGDELTIIGYPGVGGATVTITRGIVSGYLPDEGWLKTDAGINKGNSGGAAINRAGQLVGVPSAETSVAHSPGKLGLVRPINLAQDLLALIH
ncbi:MAG: trypsin-like peptidase domain-containing protein [Caldilineaceae bacterium]|nr:trypsin-like peptidase domain-containing protein [Caldilineaceae bacterium]